MKLQNLTVIFIIIIIPVILLVSLYISTGIKTIKYQSLYDTGLLTATHDAIYAFELNTTNDVYSDNAETKRNILKSSVKMFEKSLANTCGISAYNVDQIEEYIPAIVFGMHDGFYMYAPSLNPKTGKYEHSLKNYVYYSETLDDGTVIRYSLDNYVSVSGKFSGKYETKEGYLINYKKNTDREGIKYQGIKIDEKYTDAINYYKDAYNFSEWFDWFLNVSNGSVTSRFDDYDYLKIGDLNDPEDPNSAFVQHKNKIIKEKIESVLNSSITAYSERTWGQTYKMPKLSEEDWQKIYSNISMITFFQGKSIGLTKYNGYCVLNSTNSNEYVNPNLMYFINGEDDTDHYYHDIRCENINKDEKLIGYKIGDFQKIKLSKALNEDGTPKTDSEGKQLYDDNGTKTTNAYKYNHSALACYDCINGSLSASTSVYDYVKPDGAANPKIKTAYWTSLARERYKTVKLLKENESADNDEEDEGIEFEADINNANNAENKIVLNNNISSEINLTNKESGDPNYTLDLNGKTVYNNINITNTNGQTIINNTSTNYAVIKGNVDKAGTGTVKLKGNIKIIGDIKVQGLIIEDGVEIIGNVVCSATSQISGGTINGTVTNWGALTISGGTIDGSNNYAIHNRGTLKVLGGNITSNTYAIYSQTDQLRKSSISGGNITGKVYRSVINGGTINGKLESCEDNR